MKHWFLPQTPDVLALLRDQASVTVAGIDAFAEWSGGDLSLSESVMTYEHQADEARREVQRVLRTAFSTPLDPEDLYELSERLDAVLNAAKNAVREAEVMGLTPDAALAAMGHTLAEGTRQLSAALSSLHDDPNEATAAADRAIKCQRKIERTYRSAMSELMGVDDLRHVIAWREMYRRYARAGELIVVVAERVWYALVKAG